MAVCVPSRLMESIVYVGQHAPVDEVVRDEYLHADIMEVRGYHIVSPADAYDIGVRIVRGEYWVYICPVALVSPLQRL